MTYIQNQQGAEDPEYLGIKVNFNHGVVAMRRIKKFRPSDISKRLGKMNEVVTKTEKLEEFHKELLKKFKPTEIKEDITDLRIKFIKGLINASQYEKMAAQLEGVS